MEKLDAFERELEDACEYLDDHKGRRHRSCSTKKGMRMLQKACAHLREKCEEKFESEESSDDEDEEWCYPVRGVLVQGKGVQVGASQRSHQKLIETPIPTSRNYPNEVILPSNNHNDELNVCKLNEFTLENQKSEF